MAQIDFILLTLYGPKSLPCSLLTSSDKSQVTDHVIINTIFDIQCYIPFKCLFISLSVCICLYLSVSVY